jgi:anthranilate synthase component 2
MIVLIDNYDSFAYNLAQYVWESGAQVEIFRNDRITPEQVIAMQPDGIIISPGPCTPDEAGISVELIRQAPAHTPIFGVCLGHQAIGRAYGAAVIRAPHVVHGKVSNVRHSGRSLIFAGIPEEFAATRYHSLIVDRTTLPRALQVTAVTDSGLVMAMEHTSRPVYGVQFHPESILTSVGHRIVDNFVRLCARERGTGYGFATDAEEVARA